MDKLYETGFFGTSTPISIQRTMWWKISLLFGYRGRDESTKLLFGDIKLVHDELKNLEWDTERGSKTRSGGTAGHQRSFNPTAHQFNTSRCPVKIYKEYMKRRPVEACNPDSRFFLTPIPLERVKGGKWFYTSPLGKNQIGKMLQGALVGHLKAQIQGSCSKISNHSVRKTGICRLLQNDVYPLHVSQLTGHKIAM